MQEKLRVGLFFGGRSVEHEVSVITALQAFENLDKNKYEAVPVYVSKAGDFYTSQKFLDLKKYQDIDSLILQASKVTFARGGLQTLGFFHKFIPLDLAFPLFHGSFGEDGSFQGLLEMYGIPYVGFGVLGSAIAMDKVLSKLVFQALDLPIGKYAAIKRGEKIDSKDLKFPVIVKPAIIGSSIGINKVDKPEDLEFYVEVAGTYSEKILIEEAFENCIEVNCSALGYKDVKISVCEQPIPSAVLLSFEDKYQKGPPGGETGSMKSMSRKIPAPISEKLTKQIQDATKKIFKALDGCGVARVDFFVDPKQERFWVNEVNSPPGSLAYYLWEKSGIKFSKLLDMLIEFALERSQDHKKTTYAFDSGLLSQLAKRGGIKS
ncbi:D-alanine--D-alanine ligase [Candidatus Daviesbacteria bacterium]|nr:D-alanine--D-alanine ligase [Candidatus Daviesbacteria bacterium]